MTNMKRFTIPAGALAAAVLLWGCSDTLTLPEVFSVDVSNSVIDPSLPEDGSLQTCPDGVDGWVKIDSSTGDAAGDWGSFEYSGDTLEYDINSGYTVQFCIKSGAQTDGTQFYEIVGPEEDEITIAQDISHVAWRLITSPEENGEWCSPGFWRNNPLAVAETGVDMSQTYFSVFGEAPERSPQGVRQGAPTDPTLQQVLDNPQWYGGEAFNNVGDLLSHHHPDVDFDMDEDERTEDSCPLSADASRE
jgi:hypothetical protein